MKQTLISAFTFFMLLSSAMAFDKTQCPANFAFNIDSVQVYATSMYDDAEGWQETRKDLLTLPESVSINFKLTSAKTDSCNYRSNYGELKSYAKLTERERYDYESGETYMWNRLMVSITLNESRFYMFVPVEIENGRFQQMFWDDSVKISSKLNSWFDFGVIDFSLD